MIRPSYPDGEEPGVSPEDVVNLAELESDGFSLTLPSGEIQGDMFFFPFLFSLNITILFFGLGITALVTKKQGP